MLEYILWGVATILIAAVIYMTVYLWGADNGIDR